MLLVPTEFEVFGNHFLVLLSPRKVFIAKKLHVMFHPHATMAVIMMKAVFSMPSSDVMLLYTSTGTRL